MYNYSQQLEFVQSLRLGDGDKRTLTCPSCGKYNKFTVDKFDGKYIWNCYSASCNVKGSYAGMRGIDAAKNYLKGSPTQKARRSFNKLPEFTTQAKNKPEAIEYLKSVNAYEAYNDGLIKVRYAPTDNRVLFYTPDSSGAVGRALDGRLPKWWSYGDTTKGISVGTGDHAVLVEDVASACSVSRVQGLVGYALLGTNLTRDIKMSLNKYTKVTLVLDSDASSKAIYLSKRHRQVKNLRFTQKDLKWLTCAQIETLLS